jgi:hypothetical protein
VEEKVHHGGAKIAKVKEENTTKSVFKVRVLRVFVEKGF